MDVLKAEEEVWRTAGGDRTRAGRFSNAVSLKSRPVRQLATEGSIQAAVVFDHEGRAFIGDMSGSVQAYSPQGKLIWRTKLSGGISATPTVDAHRPHLYVGTQTGAVICLDTTTGARVWTRSIPTRSDPRILSDVLDVQGLGIVLSSWGGLCYRLDPNSGDVMDSWDAGISPSSAAAGAADGSVYCLRASDGQGVELVCINSGQKTVLHRVPEDKQGARRALVAAAPIVDEKHSMIYFIVNREQSSVLHAFSLRSKSLTWTTPLPHAVQATPALRYDGILLICDLSGSLSAIGTDGVAKFSYPSGCEYLLAGPVIDSGGNAYFGDPLGIVHTVDHHGAGKKLFETPRSIQARFSFDPKGNLHVPSTNHLVYVFANRHGSQERSG